MALQEKSKGARSVTLKEGEASVGLWGLVGNVTEVMASSKGALSVGKMPL